MVGIAIPLAALIVALGSLLASQMMSLRTLRQTASNDYAQEQSKRIDSLTREVAACQADRRELQKQVNALKDREFQLMERLLRLEGPS